LGQKKKELKHTNLNGEIVLARDLNPIEPLFSKIVEIKLKNKSYMLFFQEILCLLAKQGAPELSHQKSKWNESRLCMHTKIKSMKNKLFKFLFQVFVILELLIN